MEADPQANPIAQVRQQRKLLTILFTDVVGSTSLSRQLDPEELLEFMDPALKRLARPVEEHGGRVTRFQGDGFKAIFGLPVAHENDPEMAVRAGLGILAACHEIARELEWEHGIPGFQMRVGINTGLVVSGGLTEGDDTIGGEAINLAARLESAAPPGGLLISYNTYRHVRGIFNVVPIDPVLAKGFTEPVNCYLVKSAKPRAFRVQSRGVEGIETRMVGRNAELELLQGTLMASMEDSEGQVVTVLGEAGVGKSRLLYEFQNWMELMPTPVRLYLGRARPETQNLPYALLRDLFAYRFQIQDGDPGAVAREKFEKGICEAFQVSRLEGTGEANAHLLGQLLGIDFSNSPHLKDLTGDPRGIRNFALESLVDYFTAICQSETAVIFLEDLHWADDSSLDAINFLGRRSQDLPLLLVGLARPSLLERRPHWGEGQLYHCKVHLEPLSKRESRQLVEEILQKIGPVPVELRELVVNGAEGNPFYIEELVKMLVEQGVIVTGEESWQVQAERMAQVDVPGTLVGVLQARLDSLPGDERALLQQASVIGRVFWDRALEYLHSRQNGEDESVRSKLSELRDKEMVFRREESIFAQACEYIFKHEILREVTYESVLKKMRRLYHGWVADWLMEQESVSGLDYSGLIAGHLEHAGRIEQARAYLGRAAKAALVSYANAEAARYFRRALDLDPPKTDRPPLLGGLAEALQRQGYREEAIEIWHEGIDLYQAQGDLEGVARFYTATIRSLVIHQPKAAVQESELALSAVVGLQDCRASGTLSHECARAYYFHGQLEQARPLGLKALELAESLGELELQADTLVTMGLFRSDQPEEARNIVQQAAGLAEEHGFLYVATRAHNNLSVASTRFFSDLRTAISHMLRALEIARKCGDVESEVFYLTNVIGDYSLLGDNPNAQVKLDELERVIQKMPEPELAAGPARVAKQHFSMSRGQLGEAFQRITDSLNEDRLLGILQNIYYTTFSDFTPVVLDMHRYLDWEDWEVTNWVLDILAEPDQTSMLGTFTVPGEADALLCAMFARQGRVEEARQRLQQAQKQIPDHPLATYWALLRVAEAELSITEERWEEAIDCFTSLLEWYTRAEMRVNQGRTLLNLGEMHRLRGGPGDQEQALDLYQQAGGIFAEIGSPGYIEILNKRLKLLTG